MMAYAEREVAKGVPLRMISKAMLGWMTGRVGARNWRRMLSDPASLNRNDPALIGQAWEALRARARASEADTPLG
jgi:tRNA-dihydrouridine synthase A